MRLTAVKIKDVPFMQLLLKNYKVNAYKSYQIVQIKRKLPPESMLNSSVKCIIIA